MGWAGGGSRGRRERVCLCPRRCGEFFVFRTVCSSCVCRVFQLSLDGDGLSSLGHPFAIEGAHAPKQPRQQPKFSLPLSRSPPPRAVSAQRQKNRGAMGCVVLQMLHGTLFGDENTISGRDATGFHRKQTAVLAEGTGSLQTRAWRRASSPLPPPSLRLDSYASPEPTQAHTPLPCSLPISPIRFIQILCLCVKNIFVLTG